MTCRDCQSRIFDYSAETLSSQDALSMREHFQACPSCSEEWVAIERTLFVVSSLHQPLPTPLASEQMWHRCTEHIFNKVEAERLKKASSDATSRSSVLFSPSAETIAVPQSGFRGWFSRQPRWSWATLGAAVAVLGGVWFFTPSENTFFDGPGAAPSFAAVDDNPGELIESRRPPVATSSLVNHHSALAVDPFTDYVGATMVSTSGTAVSTTSVRTPSQR